MLDKNEYVKKSDNVREEEKEEQELEQEQEQEHLKQEHEQTQEFHMLVVETITRKQVTQAQDSETNNEDREIIIDSSLMVFTPISNTENTISIEQLELKQEQAAIETEEEELHAEHDKPPSEEESFQPRQTDITARDTETDVLEEWIQDGESKVCNIDKEVHETEAMSDVQNIQLLAFETELRHTYNTLKEFRSTSKEDSVIEYDEGKLHQQGLTDQLGDDNRGRKTDGKSFEGMEQTEIGMNVTTSSSIQIPSHYLIAQDGYLDASAQSVDDKCANVHSKVVDDDRLRSEAVCNEVFVKDEGELRVLEWLNSLSERDEVKVSGQEVTVTKNLSSSSMSEATDIGLSTIPQQTTPFAGLSTNNFTELHSCFNRFFQSFADDNDIEFAEGMIQASSDSQSATRSNEDSRSEILSVTFSPSTQTYETHRGDDSDRKKSSRDGYHDMLEVFGISDDLSSRSLGVGKDRHQLSTSSIESLESIDPDVVKMLEAYGMVNNLASTEEIKTECSSKSEMNPQLVRPESPMSIADEHGPEHWRYESTESNSSQYFQAFEESFLPINEIELGDANVAEIREVRNISPEAVFPSDIHTEELFANTATQWDDVIDQPNTTALLSHSMEDDGSSFDFTGTEPLSRGIEHAGSHGIGTEAECKEREEEEEEEEEEQEQEEQEQQQHQEQQQEEKDNTGQEHRRQEEEKQKQTEITEQQQHKHAQAVEYSEYVETCEERGDYGLDEKDEGIDVEKEHHENEGEQLIHKQKDIEVYSGYMKAFTARESEHYYSLKEDTESADEEHEQKHLWTSETSQQTKFQQSTDASSIGSQEHLSKSTSKHVSFYESLESEEDISGERANFESIRKKVTEVFYTLDNSQSEDMYYDARDSSQASSQELLVYHEGHAFNNSLPDMPELSASSNSILSSREEFASATVSTELQEVTKSGLHGIDENSAIDHKEYKFESNDLGQISETLTFIDRKERRLDKCRDERKSYELRKSFSSENDFETIGEASDNEPTDTLTEEKDLDRDIPTSSSETRTGESQRSPSEVPIHEIGPSRLTQSDGFHDDFVHMDINPVCADISVESYQITNEIVTKPDAESMSVDAYAYKPGEPLLSAKSSSDAAEFHGGERHLEEMCTSKSELFLDMDSAETDEIVENNNNRNESSDAQSDEELFASIEETAISPQLDDNELFSSTKLSTSQSAIVVEHFDTPVATEEAGTSLSANGSYSTPFETQLQSQEEEQTGAAEDDDYTTQLAEVHSVMASLSRRVSCDVDLCHLDVIAAIDTLVEKMAFELQQGTLSAADIMQEISNLTSGRPRFGISESNPPSLRESREGSPGVASRPIARTFSVRGTDSTAQMSDDSVDSSSLKREQLEMQIYDILDEIMTLLGAVSKQGSISVSDSQSEENVNDGFSGDNTDVTPTKPNAGESTAGQIRAPKKAADYPIVDGPVDDNELQLEEYRSPPSSTVHMEDIEGLFGVPYDSIMDKSVNLSTTETFDADVIGHTGESYSTLGGTLATGEQLEKTPGELTALNNGTLILSDDLIATDQPDTVSSSDISNTENQPEGNISAVCTEMWSPKTKELSYQEVDVETEMSGVNVDNIASTEDKTIQCVSESGVITEIFEGSRSPAGYTLLSGTTKPDVDHMYTHAPGEEIMRGTCEDYDERYLETYNRELTSQTNEEAAAAAVCTVETSSRDVSSVMAPETSDDEFDIIDMSEVESVGTPANMSDSCDDEFVSEHGYSDEHEAEKQIFNQETMSSIVCGTDDKNTSADGDHSLLYKLQTLYYVDQQQNELCTGIESPQQDVDAGEFGHDVNEHKALQSSDVLSEAEKSEIRVHEIIKVPHIPPGVEESTEQDDRCANLDSSLSSSTYSESITDLSKSEEQMQSSFDERLADELAENIVNEVLASQEQQYRLADTLKTLHNIPEDFEGVYTELWDSSHDSFNAHSASILETEKCPPITSADYNSLPPLERNARSVPFKEDDVLLPSTTEANSNLSTTTDVGISTSSAENTYLSMLSKSNLAADEQPDDLTFSAAPVTARESVNNIIAEEKHYAENVTEKLSAYFSEEVYSSPKSNFAHTKASEDIDTEVHYPSSRDVCGTFQKGGKLETVEADQSTCREETLSNTQLESESTENEQAELNMVNLCHSETEMLSSNDFLGSRFLPFSGAPGEAEVACEERNCPSVLSVDAVDSTENKSSASEQPTTLRNDYTKTVQDDHECDDIGGDETDEDSQFADFDDSDSEFETVEFRERLQEEVASAISKEIVLMAEVEVAMEDLTSTKDMLYSPSEEMSSTEGFHLPASAISHEVGEIHEAVATSVSCIAEEPKPVFEHESDPDYYSTESYHEVLTDMKCVEDSEGLQATEFAETYSNERIPSVYERSMSAKLSRAISDDPAKWHYSFGSESDPFTSGIVDIDVWGSDGKRSSDLSDEQSMSLERANFDKEVMPLVKLAQENENVFTEDYSSCEDESTDGMESRNCINDKNITSLSKTTSDETSSTSLEARLKHKHEISKSKRRRLQRLRRKHAEMSTSSSLELSSETHPSMDTQEVQGEDVRNPYQKNHQYVELQSSLSTDSSPETQSKYSERKGESIDKLDQIMTEEKVYAPKEMTEEPRKSREYKKKLGDNRLSISDTENTLAAVRKMKAANTEDERNIFQQSSESTGGRDVQSCEGTGDEASGSTMPVLQISSSDVEEGTLQEEPVTEQAGAGGLRPDRSAVGRPRSRSRSKSPAPPNLRRITGLPQRRRPRKNIVVVTNPQKF